MEPTYSRPQLFVGAIVALLAAALLALFVVGAFRAAFPSSFGPDCEALYNEYTSTVDMPTRDALFAQGMDSGCFHYN